MMAVILFLCQIVSMASDTLQQPTDLEAVLERFAVERVLTGEGSLVMADAEQTWRQAVLSALDADNVRELYWFEFFDERAGDPRYELPEPLDQVFPEYTPEAALAEYEGEVVVVALVTTEGAVAVPGVSRAHRYEPFNRRALEAALSWRFEPARIDGEPVAMIAEITFTYRMRRTP